MRAQPYLQQPLSVIPDLFALNVKHPGRYPHLLVSSAKGNELSRYDILFAFPGDTIHCSDNAAFLPQLDAAFSKEKIPTVDTEIPFIGGWLVYLGYELAAEIEPCLNLPQDDVLPVAFATRFSSAIIVDHKNKSACIVCEPDSEPLLALIQDDISKLDHVEYAYQQPIKTATLIEDDPDIYLQQVQRIKAYIVEGDVFQVNLSRGWKTELQQDIHHASLMWNLSRQNPGPFNAMVTLGDTAIISSSPERLIKVKNNAIETRPIAGTRPRSHDHHNDQLLSDELLRHPKERAEHIMLIDLERNDLGRICEPGSVNVDELMTLESYQHVHHIVSNVRGKLKPDITPGQVIAAVFPGGTITGCPKVRCMEILAELEQVSRNAYTGSLGYLNRDGSMDLNILIRTMIRQGNKITFRAGGGIVADSDPLHELNETRAKAKAMIMVLGGDA
ncbi:MAG: aminodeoxychorismate synthase component I [Gammaproteobacteria bacterium]|nr:MAG: aminodeoxychorismate synthase component I [Gammaproteobacteria bacterium]